jgi:uncharacterized membrane protein YeaQ/YmgE (transglycosylase-associated protein family)
VEHGHIWLAWILIGVAIGWLSGRMANGPGFGASANIVSALVGALLGGFLTTHFGFGGKSGVGQAMSILIAAFGAVALAFLVGAATRAMARADRSAD